MTNTVPRRIARLLPSLAMLALTAGAASCQLSSVSSPTLIGEGTRILFIGNSYTYINDVPGLVQAMGEAAGVKLAVATVGAADYALIDHWNEGTGRREAGKSGWAFVVLQQGPSSVEVNRDTLRLAAKLFAGAMTSGAKPALFSAWPTSGRRVDFPRAIESYRLAATDVNGVFLPVAGAWLAAWERDPNIVLYAPDGLHTSANGAYLTALTIFARLTNRSPIGVPSELVTASGGRLQIPAATAKLLQEAAAEAVK
jgi:hypothetical protein